MTVPRVLIIAGSDSSGGAGIEADSRVLGAHGVYTMTAITALTVQNTLGVQDVVVTAPEVVGKMINANLEDIGCDAVKIGMLASAKTIEVVADALEKFNVKTIVLDPVMVSTSGSQLLPGDAVTNLRLRLIPKCTILTPNIPEATLLLREADIQYKTPTNLDDLKLLAKQVHQLGPSAILLKGGHMPLTKEYQKANSDSDKQITVDILYDGTTFTTIESPYQSSTSTHGTGCSLASAMTANLVNHPTQILANNIRSSIRYVGHGIATAPSLGHGSGPINHFHSTTHLPFTRGHFLEYILSRADVIPTWKAFTQHRFTQLLATNTLPQSIFKTYLVQDYLYLVHFARSHALAASKASRMHEIAASAALALSVKDEMAMHVSVCADFGISLSQLETADESTACTAYSRFILDTGHSGDWLALQMAMLPCLVGYGVVADAIVKNPTSVTGEQGNRYWVWVENYVSEGYRDAVKKGVALVEEHIVNVSPGRIEELVGIFVKAARLEVEFWNLDGVV